MIALLSNVSFTLHVAGDHAKGRAPPDEVTTGSGIFSCILHVSATCYSQALALSQVPSRIASGADPDLWKGGSKMN